MQRFKEIAGHLKNDKSEDLFIFDIRFIFVHWVQKKYNQQS